MTSPNQGEYSEVESDSSEDQERSLQRGIIKDFDELLETEPGPIDPISQQAAYLRAAQGLRVAAERLVENSVE